MTRWCAVAAMGLLVGCGSPGGETPVDAPTGPDVAVDAGADVAGTEDSAGDVVTGPLGPRPREGTPEGHAVCDLAQSDQVIDANPTDYLIQLDGLQAGDRLVLAPGVYTDGLPISDLLGDEKKCIVITGPESGEPAVFLGSSARNTVSIRDSAWVVIRHLELDGQGEWGDGVKAEGDASFAHHITVEHLHIHGHDVDQQVVGINTKCPAWGWTIRHNHITTTGTGMYLGDSDGSAEHVGVLIEHNVITGTIGYNLQIKHQTARSHPDMPDEARTILRHNVFSKGAGSADGDAARPNLLLGHLPLAGKGADDVYLVYGNLFYGNPTEALVQAEGNVALYANLLVAPDGTAVNIRPHHAQPREVDVFANTVLAWGTGIRVTGGDAKHTQRVRGNAVFAATGVDAPDAEDNLVAPRGQAADHLVAPDAALGAGLDLHPLAGKLGGAWDWTLVDGYLSAHLDFDRRPHEGSVLGAYAGPVDGSGWALALGPKL